MHGLGGVGVTRAVAEKEGAWAETTDLDACFHAQVLCSVTQEKLPLASEASWPPRLSTSLIIRMATCQSPSFAH